MLRIRIDILQCREYLLVSLSVGVCEVVFFSYECMKSPGRTTPCWTGRLWQRCPSDRILPDSGIHMWPRNYHPHCHTSSSHCQGQREGYSDALRQAQNTHLWPYSHSYWKVWILNKLHFSVMWCGISVAGFQNERGVQIAWCSTFLKRQNGCQNVRIDCFAI